VYTLALEPQRAIPRRLVVPTAGEVYDVRESEIPIGNSDERRRGGAF